MAAAWQPLILQLDSCCEMLASDAPEGRHPHVFRGPRLKMGIAWGDLQAVALHSTTGRAAYYGPTVNLAARVEAAASGGQVLLATPPEKVSRTKSMIQLQLPQASCFDLGLLQMKGISGMKNILQVQLQELSHRPFPSISQETMLSHIEEKVPTSRLLLDERARLIIENNPPGLTSSHSILSNSVFTSFPRKARHSFTENFFPSLS